MLIAYIENRSCDPLQGSQGYVVGSYMAAIAAMNGTMSGPLNGTDTLVSMVTFGSLLDYHGTIPHCASGLDYSRRGG